ncbi:MAG: outer membrane lipoprotein-sorting protein, partial [Pseudomonadota bacterium]|nr:outer membrane lipoprotein-sorting protein [Pseudomonadota bacterium]
MIGKNNVLSLCFICIVVATMASAETADEKGLAIAIEADLRDQGWIDNMVELQMILRNAKGNESKRQLRLRSLEVP